MSVFQAIDQDNWIGQTKYFFLIYDNYPVSPGHILAISKEKKLDYFDLSEDEIEDLHKAILLARKTIDSEKNPDGYNIGMNCGEAAGQSVMHFHCHIIPRYFGDMDNPKGGIRYCIPEKGLY